MLVFEKLRYKNFLSSGNQFTEIILNKHSVVACVGVNGSGKCLHKSTEIEIQFKDEETQKKFLKMLTKSI